MLLGLAVLASRWHIGPRSGQTVLSQIMAAAVGRHWAYYVVTLTITLVLALAANTSFGGLPVLASLLSRDNYLPHLFSLRGDRQVFANGILALSVLSGALLIAVGGNTNSLIPLFAIGVFTGFTLAQSGLVVHWSRERPTRWRRRAAINGFGAVVTAVSTVVFLISKFTEGAWVVVVAVPTFVLLFKRIHAYYDRVGAELGFGTRPPAPVVRRALVIVPVTSVSRLTERALSKALSLGDEVIAVTVALGGDEESNRARRGPRGQRGRAGTRACRCGCCARSTRRWCSRSAAFIDDVRASQDVLVVVLIPKVIPSRARYAFLHNHLDLVLSAALRNRDDIVVARVGLALGRPVGPPRRAAPPAPSSRGPDTDPSGTNTSEHAPTPAPPS